MATKVEVYANRIEQQLNKPLSADSATKIEGIIAEMEAAKIDFSKHPRLHGLHKRHLDRMRSLSGEVKENLRVTITQAELRHERLKGQIGTVVLPAFVFNNPQIMKALQDAGIVNKGSKNRALLENPEVKKNFEEYMDFLGFIENTPRDGREAIVDRKGLVQRYRKLNNISNNKFIGDKRFLQYMYAEALYEDIIARGYILEKSGENGEYSIVCPEVVGGKIVKKKLQDKFPGHEYLDILKGPETRNHLEVVMVGSIMAKNFTLESKPVVGQKSMIHAILEQNVIKSRDGKRITKAELLLIDWKETILPQVDSKLEASIDGDDVSIQVYQELTYLKNFIEREEYMKPDYNTTLFKEANVYRKAFLAEKAFIDAFGGDAGDGGEKSLGDIIAKAGGELRGPLLITAVLAYIAGFKKFALGAASVGLLGPSIGSIIDTGVDGAKGVKNFFTEENLEIIRPGDVRYDLNVPDGIAEKDIETTLAKLYAANEGNRKAGGLTGKTLTNTVSNAAIAKVYTTILKNDDALGTSFSDSATTAGTIYNLMGGASATIDSGDFGSRLPKSEAGKIKIEDVQAVLTLMGTTIKEDTDETFGDIVYEGRDPSLAGYAPLAFGFTGKSSSEFEAGLNGVLEAARTNTKTRKQIARVDSVKKTLAAKLGGEGVDVSSITDLTARSQALLQGELTETRDAIALIKGIPVNELTFNSVNYKDEIIKQLEQYKDFVLVDDFLTEYDGIFATGVDAAAKTKSKLGQWGAKTGLLSGATDGEKVDDAILEIDQDLNKFANIAQVEVAHGTDHVDISTNALYSPLKKRYEDIAKQLQERKTELTDIKAGIAGAASGAVSGALAGTPNINRLTPQEQAEIKKQFSKPETSSEFKKFIDDTIANGTFLKEASTVRVGNVKSYVDRYGAAYIKAQGVHAVIRSLTGTSTTHTQLQTDYLKALVLDNYGDKFKTKVVKALEKDFAKMNALKTKVARTRVSTTTIGGPGVRISVDIRTLENARKALQNAQSEVQKHFGITTSIFNMDATQVKPSNTTLAFESAKKTFGSLPTIPHSDITNESIYESIAEKQEALQKGIVAKVTTASLEEMVELFDSTELISFADKELAGVDFKQESRNRIEALVMEKINGFTTNDLTTLEQIRDFAKGDFQKARTVNRWSLDDQPAEALGSLRMDEEIKERTESIIKGIISSLGDDTTGLENAEKLAESLGWTPSSSTLGIWRDSFMEGFSDFTGLAEKGDIRISFDKRLEKIRKELYKSPLNTSMNTYTVLNDKAKAVANTNASLANKIQGHIAGPISNILVKYASDTDVQLALKNDYLIN